MHVTLQRLGAAITCWAIVATAAWAHPGSGIIVDDRGAVYFVHAEVGIWKTDATGMLSKVPGPSFHFMTFDRKRAFKASRLPRVDSAEVSLAGEGLILSSSFPLAVGSDGNLYYPVCEGEGPVQIMKMSPQGDVRVHATLPPAPEISYEGEPIIAKWIHGLATGPDGTLYYTEKQAVRRISPDGEITAIAENITVPDCVHPPAIKDDRGGPVLRGLDVAADGVVYAAASACGAVIRLSDNGELTVALRTTDAWSPTGIDVVGKDVYVLENYYVEAERARDWLPRVRKIAADGAVTVLATVTSPR